MLTDEFDYTLPEELIASRPLPERDASRMMVIDRRAGTWQHMTFRAFPEWARGSLVVLNDTRVAKARFLEEDGKVEVLRLEMVGPDLWKCLIRPGKRFKLGAEVTFGGGRALVEKVLPEGERLLRILEPIDESRGHLPLPHYFKRSDDEEDETRYQTVYADPTKEAAVAAPTAGLHFTPKLLAETVHTFVTLHVGAGTFRPVKAAKVEEHVMHAERYEITTEAAAKINAAANVLAVGTTVTRVLEHEMAHHDTIKPGAGETAIFIYPGFRFRKVAHLLTNFHLPKSTLFMLVCAFAGTDLMKAAYADAVRERYRFYSYGDCMLIL